MSARCARNAVLKMLRPIAADGDYKKLECPSCRVVTAVLRGKASNLPKNFSLLR